MCSNEIIDGVGSINIEAQGEPESSIVTCKNCKVTHKRFLSGKYPDGRNKRWVDASGREFCGSICPSCHVARVALRNRNRRQLRKMLKKVGDSNE